MITILATFVFLFALYVLSKDDFVLLRKNISQITLFDFAFIAGIVGLFFSRLIFVLSHFSSLYLNPLVFFVIPYFPGLSLAGLLLGGCTALYMLTVRRKAPIGRIFDIFSFAFIATMVVVSLSNAVVAVLHRSYMLASTYGIVAILLWIASVVLHTIFIKSVWKDGTIAFINFPVVAIASVLGEEAVVHFQSFVGDAPYFTLFFVLLLVSFFLQKFSKRGART